MNPLGAVGIAKPLMLDLAIRYGRGDYPGLYSEKLLEEAVFPVCSPALLEGARPLRVLADLEGFILIHDESSLDDESCPDWSMWLKAAAIKLKKGHQALHVDQSNLAIEAAIAGRGIALAKAAIAASDIASGKLVRPFRESHPVAFGHNIVCPRENRDTARVKNFIAWLKREAARTQSAAAEEGVSPLRHRAPYGKHTRASSSPR